MRASYLEELRSPFRGIRMAAWSDLHLEPETSHGCLALKDRRELHKILREEEDDGVLLTGLVAIEGLGCACQIETPAADPAVFAQLPRKRAPKEHTLDDWVSQLFERRSAVLGTSEAHRCRDEDALAQVARLFPSRSFHQTDLQHVSLGDDSWFQLLVDHRYETILVIGRLWMFGQKALANFEDEKLHLKFPERFRPQQLEHGAIDVKYHCIHEYNGGSVPVVYSTNDEGNIRTDYGVVQIYPGSSGCSWITVVLCAGCSSLGTLGAAWWLAYDLWRPHRGHGSSPIPTPPGANANSRMEALIRVTANLTEHVWRPSHIELRRLYFDDHIWLPDESEWRRTKVRKIEVELGGNGPVSLLIDGQPVVMQTTSQAFRLAAELALAIARSPTSSVSIEALAKNRFIWGDDERPTCEAKRRLHTLNSRSMHGLIYFDGDEVRLDGEVLVRQV